MNEIQGQIVKYHKVNNFWTITVRTKERYEMDITCPKYLHVFPGDSISAQIDDDNNLVSEPIVMVFQNQDGMNKCLLKVFSGKTATISRVNSFLKRQKINPCEVLSQYAERFRVDKENTILEFSGCAQIEYDDAEKLLIWWSCNYLMRKLLLLGCTREEILECEDYHYNMTTLYDALMSQPMKVYNIKLETCIKIADDWSLEKGDVKHAQEIREINEHLKKVGWTCMPVDGRVKQYLIDDFDCEIRHNCLYLPHMITSENIIARFLSQDSYVKDLDMSPAVIVDGLNDLQVESMNAALKYRFSCIYGGPGTGKSTIISRLFKELEARNFSAISCAFTGTAVMRIQTMKVPSKTIHGLLPDSEQYDYIIFDEMSMVSIVLLSRAIEKHGHDKTRLIFVGDKRQLPSIDEGEVFRELISYLPGVELMENKRTQNKNGTLFHNINLMCDDDPDFSKFKWGGDMLFHQGDESEVYRLVEEAKERGEDDMQVTIICPYKEPNKELNIKIRMIWNPNPFFVKDSFGNRWAIGDRIMMTKNRYDINIMNGTEGRIIAFEENKLVCEFKNNKTVKIPTCYPKGVDEDLDGPLTSKLLILSWALTTHKGQGGEWNNVKFFIPPGKKPSGFLSRRLGFTSISRPKTHLDCIASDYDILAGCLILETPTRVDNLGMTIQMFKEEQVEKEMSRVMI